MSAPAEAAQNAEASPLAREMVAAVRAMVESYRNAYGLTQEQAVAKVCEPPHPDYLEIALSRPPDQVSWLDLENIRQPDSDRAVLRWEEIKQAARHDLASGHRASRAVEEYASTPWKRASFLALREELLETWQPRNGVERQLLETMAQAQTAAEFWLGRLTSRATLEAAMEQVNLEKKGRWDPPRVTEFRAVEQAAAMADRFNRIFLRTLRVLRDLRRCPPPVFVQNAGQVNVGQLQVNVVGQGP
jgi:hypothetical protein